MAYLAAFLCLLSTINSHQPPTCSDIMPIGPVQTVKNCESNSPTKNGNCCSCKPNPNAPYNCMDEGCSISMCPKVVNKFTTTINEDNIHYSESIDSVKDIDDDFNDIQFADELEGTSSDNGNDDDLHDSEISASFENESQDGNTIDSQNVYSANGDDYASEKQATVFRESKAFNGILYGTIGIVILVSIMAVAYYIYKRSLDIHIHRKLSIEVEDIVECVNEIVGIDTIR